jgi:hypothetical protein
MYRATRRHVPEDRNHNPLWKIEIRRWRLGEDVAVESEGGRKRFKHCITVPELLKLCL